VQSENRNESPFYIVDSLIAGPFSSENRIGKKKKGEPMSSKMSNRKFRSILIPIIGITAVTMAALTVAANTYSAALDLNFGRGQRHVSTLDGLTTSDTEYYTPLFPNNKSGLGDASDPITMAENDSRNNAAKHALAAAREGVTLLKNDGVLPLAKKSSITPFGYRYVDPLWSGSGSAVTNMDFDYVVTPEEGLKAFFSVNSEVETAMKEATPKTISGAAVSGYTFPGSGSTDCNIYEYDSGVYTGHESSCNNTTGVVFIGRRGIEGTDLWPFAYTDGTENELSLSADEKAAIAFAKANCGKVIVVCNFSNIMQIGDLVNDSGINGIIWLGNPGAMGCQALGEIMAGDVNPSGRTVDTWLYDVTKDPVYPNTLPGQYSNYDKTGGEGMVYTQNYYEYEEGIYCGYRYYETAYAEAQKGNYSSFDYSKQVVYPFGYGLHYENDKITQSLSSVKLAGEYLYVDGRVTNSSSRDVKDTVQVYLEAEYHGDTSKIEKPAKSLVDFAKVSVPAGSSTNFSLKIAKDDLCSYDYLGYYAKGGAYVFENGAYTIHLGKSAHADYDSSSFNVDATLAYTDAEVFHGATAVGKRNSDGQVADNIFSDINSYTTDTTIMKNMSRSNFAGTFPSAPTTKVAPDYVVKANGAFDENDAVYGADNPNSTLYQATAPRSGEDNGVTISSLRGLDYNDPMWDDLLAQLNFTGDTNQAEISAAITYGLYMTQKVSAIGLVETVDVDGPLGLTATWSGTKGHVVACSYPCLPIIAATFNKDLAYELGESYGQEGLTNGISGWYGPAVNCHRSPFGGRNFEYYSEDPVLAGKIAAQHISGARQEGLYAHLKHFALNEMDRSRGSSMVWANEQAMREVYLKGFELGIKDATCTEKYYDGDTKSIKEKTIKATGAMMTSMDFIGPKFSACSYDLLTTFARKECGFEGFVLTDFTSGTNKPKDAAYRVGNDLWMGMKTTILQNFDKPTAQWCMKNAIHNIAYTVVNSSAYNYVAPGSYAYYDESPWKITLTIADVTVGVIDIVAIAWVIVRSLKRKEN
jgi:beta-glucosidase